MYTGGDISKTRISTILVYGCTNEDFASPDEARVRLLIPERCPFVVSGKKNDGGEGWQRYCQLRGRGLHGHVHRGHKDRRNAQVEKTLAHALRETAINGPVHG